MKDLFNRHYEATQNRGKITPKTKISEFLEKMHEEDTEVILEIQPFKLGEPNNLESELWDAICVRTNLLKKLGFDLEKGLEENTIKQENRRD